MHGFYLIVIFEYAFFIIKTTSCSKSRFYLFAHHSIFVVSFIEEQRSSIKFCVTLEKSFIKTFQMMQTAYGHEVLSGGAMDDFKGSRKVVNQSEMTIVLGDRQHRQTSVTLRW